MVDRLAGKAILVTGAGNGFGRLIAEGAAARGARLTCVDIRGEAAEAVAAAIRGTGGTAQAVAADVSSIADMRAAVAAAVAAHGAVDVIVNNAGIMPLAFLADHAEALDAWNRCVDINFKGVLNGTVAAYDAMIAQGRGHIVNISSIFGNHPVVGAAVYGATKAAVDHFSHAVRQEARGRIKVTVVKPTGVLATGLGASVVNKAAAAGIVGHNMPGYRALLERVMAGAPIGGELDPESIDYAALGPAQIAEAVLHAIDQPWGVVISDITVRAAGDHFIL